MSVQWQLSKKKYNIEQQKTMPISDGPKTSNGTTNEVDQTWAIVATSLLGLVLIVAAVSAFCCYGKPKRGTGVLGFGNTSELMQRRMDDEVAMQHRLRGMSDRDGDGMLDYTGVETLGRKNIGKDEFAMIAAQRGDLGEALKKNLSHNRIQPLESSRWDKLQDLRQKPPVAKESKFGIYESSEQQARKLDPNRRTIRSGMMLMTPEFE